MTPTEIIAHYGQGNLTRTAAALGVTRQAIHIWVKEAWVPLDWQHWVERDTAGKLKADPRRPSDIPRRHKAAEKTPAADTTPPIA